MERSTRTSIQVSRPPSWGGRPVPQSMSLGPHSGKVCPYLNPWLQAPILGRSALTPVHVSRPKSRGGRHLPQSMSRGTHLGDVDPPRLMQEARLPQHTNSIPSSSLFMRRLAVATCSFTVLIKIMGVRPGGMSGWNSHLRSGISSTRWG